MANRDKRSNQPQEDSPAVQRARALMTQSKELIRAVATEEGHPTERALPANLELTWTESMSPEEVIVQARERVRSFSPGDAPGSRSCLLPSLQRFPLSAFYPRWVERGLRRLSIYGTTAL